MALIVLLVATLGLLALLHFLVVPAARRKLGSATGPASIAAAGGFALADICRTISVLGAVSLLLCLALLGIAELGRFGDLAQVEASIRFTANWRATLEKVSPILSLSVAALCAIGIVTLGRRAASAKVSGILAAANRAEVEQIFEQIRDGSAEAMPDTSQMAEIRRKLVGITDQIAESESDLAATPEGVRGPASENQLAELRRLQETGLYALINLDIDRRRQPPRPLGTFIPAPKNRWERAQDALFSRGTLSTMNGSSRALSGIIVLLLVPSMMAVATVPAGIDLQHAEINLSQIELKLQGDAEQEHFEEVAAATALPAATTASQPSDEQTLNQLAHLYDHGVTIHFVKVGGLSDHGVSHVRLETTREHIIHAAISRNAAVHPSGTNEPLHMPAHVGNAYDDTEKLYLDLASQPQPPLSAEARRFVVDTRSEIIQKRPDLWRVMRMKVSSLGQSFRLPEDVATLRGMLISRVATAGLDVGAGVLPPDLVALGGGIEGSAAEGSYRIRSRRAWVALITGKDGEEFMAAEYNVTLPRMTVERDEAVARRLPETASLERRVAEHPPRFPVDPALNDQKVTSLVSELMRLSPKKSEAFAGTLVQYDDWFPGHVGAEKITPYGEMLKANKIDVAVSSDDLAKLSGNFKLLEGYSRVGGVLIGRGPDNPDGILDFTDVGWKTSNGSMVLVFMRGDGSQIRVGPYPTALVAGALDYAADDRPTTVTIVDAEPIKDFKVLLHPALIDTGLGWRSIAIDRFVYDFLAADSRQVAIQEGVDEALNHIELYRYGRLAFMKSWLDNLPATNDEEVKQARSELKEYVDYNLGREKQKVEGLMIDLSAVSAKALLDAGRSPLTAKKEFFDGDVVNAMANCVGPQTTTLSAFTNCMQASGVKYRNRSLGILHEPHEFGVRSGVRERQWSLDQNLTFVTALPDDALYPFDFVQQLAASDTGGDTSPFTFPAYQDQITDVVRAGIVKSPTARIVLEDMRKFTLLQRLFRAALSGQLGPRFPVEKLEDLATIANAAISAGHSPRWDAHPGYLEIYYVREMQFIANLLTNVAVYQDLVTKVTSCASSLPRPWSDKKALDLIGRISDDDWTSNCDLADLASRHQELATMPTENDPYRAYLLVRYAQIAHQARRLRDTLGVANDNTASMAVIGSGQPPPL